MRNATLKKHQNEAQYCLILQGKTRQEIETKPKRIYTCNYCDNSFSRSDNLKRHVVTCPEKSNSPTPESDKLLEMIIQLQHTIINMTDRTGTANTNRNMTMNLTPITDQELQDHLEHLTLDFITEGAKGYANFANCYPFKDRVLCTDKARKKLRYRDDAGEVVEDGGGLKLAQRFFQAIAPRNEEIINAEYRALHQEVQRIANGGTAYKEDLTGLLTKASHLQDILIKCRGAARGEVNDLTKDFINHLSKLL